MVYTDQDMENDFHWFVENYDSLYAKYGHKFFVIQNQKILGIYNGMSEAIDKTISNYPMGTFCVQECNGDESGYTAYLSTPLFML